jgi:Chaperone of endosialidase
MTPPGLIKSNDGALLRHACLLLSVICGFAWLPLAPAARAVVPPPPGGYPNFTTAAGEHALQALSLGLGNTAIGTFSLFSVTTGSFNTAVGAGALDLNTADSNTATGAAALLFNTTGTENTANGTAALELSDIGSQNTATGAFALFNNTEGNLNTANGDQALFNNTTGLRNTATGAFALFNNTIGEQNNAIGSEALFSNTTGNFNTAIGHNALDNNTTGSNNVVLGNGSGGGISTVNGVICIGSAGANVGSSCFIAQIRGKTTHNANAIPVVIDSADQLGTISSSRRFKKEITPMDKASEAILGLNPVTFQYKSDDTNTPQYGLIAEEVAEISPDLVVRDDKGEIYTVRYDAVNAMLLNEFLKQNRRVREQEVRIAQQREDFETAIAQQRKDFEATITELKKGIQTVTQILNEQAARIQKVNTQREISKAVIVE